ncbi:MAG: GNAT family N-acetyltransferase [Clostridia bacterium]|nr:GNAT family N-acetyltransferase [Clostridia bacterium]
METVIKHFDQLTTMELYEILQLRAEVFVVEQDCPYQDLDGKDLNAYHVYVRENGEVVACVRVLDVGVSYADSPSIGRVVTKYRRKGLGSIVMREGISVAREKYGAKTITISAQCYARQFYEGFGFKQVSEEYLEDGIPHIRMKWSECEE